MIDVKVKPTKDSEDRGAAGPAGYPQRFRIKARNSLANNRRVAKDPCAYHAATVFLELHQRLWTTVPKDPENLM